MKFKQNKDNVNEWISYCFKYGVFKLFSLLLFSNFLFATGGDSGDPGMLCDEASPFCSDENYNFPNINNNTYAPDGPNYGCHPGTDLPNPVWYYMEIEESGIINLTLSQSTGPNGTGMGLDVDFVMWGPFESVADGCQLVMSGAADPCQSSWSPDAVEYVSIGGTGGSTVNADFTGMCSQAQINAWTQTTLPPAQAGEVYIIVMSNWDNQNGYFSFTQTNYGDGNAGSTDCSIVEPCSITELLVEVGPCENDSYALTGTVSFSDPPETGDLILEDCEGNETIIASAPFNQESYTFEVADLPANNASCEVNVFFNEAACSESFAYTAPEMCSCDQPSLTVTDIGECGVNALDLNTAILANTDGATLTFYATETDANNGSNAINSIVNQDGTYWVRAAVPGNPNCFSVYPIAVDLNSIQYTTLDTYPTCGEANGSIEIIPNGGTAPYSFSMIVDNQNEQNNDGIFDGLGTGSFNFVIVDAEGCQTEGTTQLSNVGNELSANFSFADFCIGAANGPSNISSPGGVFSFDPEPNDGASIDPATGEIHNANSGNTYGVKYTVGEDCPNSSTQTVEVKEGPEVSFSGTNLSGCKPLEVLFTNTSTDDFTACSWTFGDGNTSNSCGEVTHTYTSSGSYNVSLTLTNEIGCSSTLTKENYVDVEQGPIASFIANPMVATVENSEVTFNNTSENADEFTWTFGDGSPTDYAVHTTHVFPNENEGNYVVTLVASNGEEACNDTLKMVITIAEELIFYVPNSFTPDHDAFNDVFLPIFNAGYDPYGYSFEIYNRWGELIFESHDVNYGWDGTYGGKVAQEGTYIWKIKIKEKNKDKHNEYQGHLTLIK